MRNATVVCAALLAACGAGEDVEVTELSLNVTVAPGSVGVYAREVARPCVCSVGEWVDPGECGSSSDAITCDCEPGPASCVERLAIERGGETVAEADFEGLDVGYAGLSGGTVGPDFELVIDGCGGTARIPIDATAAPNPTIDEIVDTGDEVTMRWSAEPTQVTSIVSVGDGFVTDICHVDVTEKTVRDFGFGGEMYLSVRTLAAPEVVNTDLGVATVWTGGTAFERFQPE